MCGWRQGATYVGGRKGRSVRRDLSEGRHGVLLSITDEMDFISVKTVVTGADEMDAM